MCDLLPQIRYSPAMLPGVPPENAFQVLDESGAKCGSGAVVEYINHTLLPEQPLNYYISINAQTERAFDTLIGATLARSIEMRWRNPKLRARIYAPCKPYDNDLLRNLQAFGFQNDDAIIRMRRILSDSERPVNPPVGCSIAPSVLASQQDFDGLLGRVNAYSVIANSPGWLTRLQHEQLFAVFGVWQQARLLGELILTAYGAEGRIEMLYTRPEFRRRGVATALISYAGQMLLHNGIRSLNAEAWRRIRPAMSLLETMRFESVAPTILYPGINL